MLQKVELVYRWLVLCIHNEAEPFLELYLKQAVCIRGIQTATMECEFAA